MLGILDPIVDFFQLMLTFFYSLTPNLGIGIILLTLIVKIITFPLNNKQMQSAKKMQKIQPELKKIQKKYKNDKQKQNQAVMEFMQKNKVNPVAGCLPLLVQFPILISIFTLLRDTQRLEMISDSPFYLFPSLEFLNLTYPDPFYVLPILAGATTFWQQKIMMTDPNQKMMLYIMPAMLLFFSINFPAGLVLYWVLNNLLSVWQQLLIGRTDKEVEAAKQ